MPRDHTRSCGGGDCRGQGPPGRRVRAGGMKEGARWRPGARTLEIRGGRSGGAQPPPPALSRFHLPLGGGLGRGGGWWARGPAAWLSPQRCPVQGPQAHQPTGHHWGPVYLCASSAIPVGTDGSQRARTGCDQHQELLAKGPHGWRVGRGPGDPSLLVLEAVVPPLSRGTHQP